MRNKKLNKYINKPNQITETLKEDDLHSICSQNSNSEIKNGNNKIHQIPYKSTFSINNVCEELKLKNEMNEGSELIIIQTKSPKSDSHISFSTFKDFKDSNKMKIQKVSKNTDSSDKINFSTLNNNTTKNINAKYQDNTNPIVNDFEDSKIDFTFSQQHLIKFVKDELGTLLKDYKDNFTAKRISKNLVISNKNNFIIEKTEKRKISKQNNEINKIEVNKGEKKISISSESKNAQNSYETQNSNKIKSDNEKDFSKNKWEYDRDSIKCKWDWDKDKDKRNSVELTVRSANVFPYNNTNNFESKKSLIKDTQLKTYEFDNIKTLRSLSSNNNHVKLQQLPDEDNDTNIENIEKAIQANHSNISFNNNKTLDVQINVIAQSKK